MGLEGATISFTQNRYTSLNCHTSVALFPNTGRGALGGKEGSQVRMYNEERIFSGDQVESSRVVEHREKLQFGTWSKIVEEKQLSGAAEALELLVQRGSPVDNYVFYGVLKRCMAEKDLVLGRKVHAMVVRSGYGLNTFLANHIICMYASHGRLTEASEVFNKISTPTRYMWASIIMAHARHNQPRQAIVLYRQMRDSPIKADDHIFVAVLKACAMAEDLVSGRQVHTDILGLGGKPSMFVGNCLVDMYAKCGSLEDARMVFDCLPRKNVITWTAMIAGYTQHGLEQEALNIYACMQQEGITPANHVTFVCLLQACASARALVEGKRLHAQIRERRLDADVVVGTCLVDMYVKCGSILEAREVFDNLPMKNVVTWNVMIAGYSQRSQGQEALSLYKSMQDEGINPADAFTFVCLLQTCSTVAGLEKGKEIHAQISKSGLQATDLYVANALVDMYCKCGSMLHAQQVFDGLASRDIVTWNALIAGYSRQGHTGVVFGLFDRMNQEAVQPDAITFLSVLSVCCHAGLLDKAEHYLDSMINGYGVAPTIELYSCMIDLLGRAGQVDRAMHMARTMPFQPDSVVWSSILGACRKWGEVELGREAFEHAVRLDRNNSFPYILMANIYATAQMPEHAQEIEAMRVKEHAWKKQGLSWLTDMNGDVHAFVVTNKETHDGCISVQS